MNRIVVIGASSGGLEALRLLLAPLPVNFSAPICVVIHTWADSPAIIHELVGHATRLKSVLARNLYLPRREPSISRLPTVIFSSSPADSRHERAEGKSISTGD